MTNSRSYAYFKNNFVPIEEANINIRTHAVQYGTAVFEGIRGYWNSEQEQLYVFRMKEHFERMQNSMKILYLEPSESIDELCSVVIELLRRNSPRTDTYIRPYVYKAATTVGPTLIDNPTEMCIYSVPFGDYFHGAGGLKCQVSSWRRLEDNAIPARAKISGSYVNAALAKTEAQHAGFDDCIMLSENGQVSEGSAMNLFLVKRGQLVTTPVSENILEGITRATIMEFAQADYDISTVTRQIDRSELYTADEVFFCGTGAQIAPVVEIDHRKIGKGSPGPISQKILSGYEAICRGRNPKYSRWLAPVYDTKSGTTTASHQVKAAAQ